ncbi:MAG TPA: serine/threonine-protein kinase [Polyangiaceae bacterium]|nr:serine/threonine-protein kinase [Polyangiaceae bacterium]
MIPWLVASLVPRLAPGSTFAERFKILDYVGQGSVGHVYRVEPLSGGEPVALKLVRLDDAADGRTLRRFEREVESGKRVQSPYVAATLDSGKLGERMAWLTMEFAPGVTLDELVRARGALTRELSRRLLSQVFAALATAHAAGIVHRDLKPENLRVAGAGDELRLKVLDFGIAKDFDGSLSHTTPGIGTPLWAAPELSRPDPQPRPSADVWSLGLLTFFVLTGHQYWRHSTENASIADLALELLRGEIAPPSLRVRELELAAELPPGFDAWFGRAVHRDPALRFRDSAEAWAALEPLLAATAERPALVVRPGPLLTAVLLTCVAAGLAIYWLLRSMKI